LVERWNRGRWSIQPSPIPPGAIFSGLSGVSCARKTACTAVGTYLTSADAYVTLAQRWDGSGWQIEPSANRAATQTHLTAVSCTAPTRCIAVGNYVDANTNPTSGTLAEGWNGTSWVIQPTPVPTDADTFSLLSGVSCAARATCTAVGESAFPLATLAERWNGTSWTIQPTP
jgi:hypothetical protein